ncbi:MAG: hypothetical protein SBU_001214 [Candidatus Syntrophoarchaeum butanivorans]|uniref:Uncharacterized protein n=1 Tax=Candidatus Syntropharchaeum butanivorans TaxID=1839936 RepID=A0A1F2P3Q1_9EURY|nr:MAG: hypothetical protein SBU_001214 [Candidatus Syntrophoarchaeum butanivorans]
MDAIRGNTRYCQFTESQAGDIRAGYITYGGERIAEERRIEGYRRLWILIEKRGM